MKLPQLLIGKSFSASVFATLVGAGLSRAITLASMAFISRIYAAEAYGSWIIILSLVTFVMPLATLRYDLAIVLAATQRMGAGIGCAILAQSFLLSCLCFLALTLLPAKAIEAISGLAAKQHIFLYLLPIVIFLTAANTVFQAWSNRERNFWGVALSITLQAIVTAALTLGLPLLFGPSGWTAAAAAIIGIATAVSVLAFQSRDFFYQSLERSFLVRAAWHGLRSYQVYAILGIPYAISAVLTERIQQLLITNYYGIGTLASFFVVRQIIMGPTSIVAGSLRQAVFAFGAQQDSLETLRKRVLIILKIMIVAVGPALAFGLAWIKPSVAILMGTRWPYLAEFSFWTLLPASMLVLTGWIDRVLDIFSKQRMALWLQLASDFCVIGLAFVGAKFGLVAVQFVEVISIAIASYNLIWLFVALNLLRTPQDEVIKLFIELLVSFGVWIFVQQLIINYAPLGFALPISILVGLLSLLPVFPRLSHVLRNGIN